MLNPETVNSWKYFKVRINRIYENCNENKKNVVKKLAGLLGEDVLENRYRTGKKKKEREIESKCLYDCMLRNV